jgi:hypothetical protein
MSASRQTRVSLSSSLQKQRSGKIPTSHMQHPSNPYSARRSQLHRLTPELTRICGPYRTHICRPSYLGITATAAQSSVFMDVKRKSKYRYPVTGRAGIELWDPDLLSNWLTDGGKVVSPTHRPHSLRTLFFCLCYSFLLEAEWAPGSSATGRIS